MAFTPVNESSSTATAIKKTALCSTITVEKAGNHSTLIDQVLATAIRYRKVVSPTMVATDTTDSTKSPPAMSPPTKLSSVESSPTKPFPTMDLIPVTSKTMDHVPVTLPFQVLESLCDGFFPDRYFDSNQEAVEIAVKELTTYDQSKFMCGVYELFTDIHEVSNAQVTWLSEFEENNAWWRELRYKRYYDYLRTIDSSGRKNKDRATKKLGDYWQLSPELLEILKDSAGFNEEINLGKMGLKLHRELVMPVAYYPCKEDQSCTCRLSPSAPLPNRQIPSASPVQISSAPSTEEDSFPRILHTPDTTLDDITEVIDNVTENVDNVAEVIDNITEVIDEDDKATSSHHKSSNNKSTETAVTPTLARTKASNQRKRAGQPPTPNPNEDKTIVGYDVVITCSNYMERDVRYTHLAGEEERIIIYYHGIYGKHAPLIVQRAINREPDVFQTARNQIVSGMIAMQNAIISAEETLGEASYFINERRKRKDERRK
ncbi:hypothetical protein K440DRAFT_644172 [Wilcoxina mikolae CBS 423.85]|nr:hypothetical protein K440DRAFT_644172 [Wilcoxina mikolae CBS 423.85]